MNHDVNAMMNQGGATGTLTTLDPNSLEPRHLVDSSQGQASSYYAPSTAASESVSWTMHRAAADNYSTETGIYSNSNFHHNQHSEPPLRNIQDGSNASSIISATSSVTANVPHEYSSYPTYPSTDPYGYGNTGYAGYYNNSYQQQPSQSYPQPVGAYQSTGAPHQPPISSFQNTGSYAEPANYSSTYYNPGDYQTSGGYTSGGYSNNQTNLWHQGSYGSYASQQYPSYTPESNGTYSSSNSAATSAQYQQHYKQWEDYYSQTEVSCAPGTENTSTTSTANPGCPVPGGYSAPNSLPPEPLVPSWRPEFSSSELPSVQPSAAINVPHDGYWKQGASGFQNHHVSPLRPNFQKPLESNPTYGSFKDQHSSEGPQGQNVRYPVTQGQHTQYPVTQAPNVQYSATQAPNVQYSVTQAPNVQYPATQEPNVQYLATQAPNVQYPANHQTPQSYHSPLPTVPQTVLPLDSRRGSKMQIPTNPKIASSFSLGVPKIEKDSSAISVATKPAYISVPLAKMKDSMPPHDAADSILKPGTFPKSLRGYVERALARCKNDTQMFACQDVMKEVITKATADGTLHTRDWDTEPLFPLPNVDTVNDGLQCSTPVSSLGKKRSPSRRSKSRWEPVPEVKPVDKSAFATPDTVKYTVWSHLNVRDKQFSAGRAENMEDNSSSLRFSLSDPKPTNKNALRPVKRQRLSDGQSGANNGDASSDSDKEQSLTAYYSAAIALTDSPEEKRRRENRSKRFDKGQGNRSVNNNFRPKNIGTGNLYTRRATALVLSKNFEDGSSRAVEDIDWDALTVKGTCLEIEKRYLRLTSAPDPATVRPEEVLEKAVLMVQNSSKNYLYKCDQLKSIRQDLTVQRIRNELTAKVYETHARLAIEVGDLSEYNQCQSQLKTLYAEGIKGCHLEFSAYHLLCVILHSNNNRDLLSAMSRLSVEARKDKAVKHALAVRAAVTSGNYVLFFRLYRTAPNLNTCLMDLYVEKMRYEAVKCMSRSYRPTLPVSYVAQVLGFASALPSIEASDEKDSDGLEECVEWLKAHGACLTTENSGEMLFDSKASTSTLYMPEPDDAVAHGDASLAVNDFLTRSSS